MLTESEVRPVKQVRSAARAVVSLTAGLQAGASQLRGSMAMLPPHLRMAHPAVDALLQSLPTHYPSGEVRLYLGEPEFLAADALIAQAEAMHRVAVLLECKAIYFAFSKLLHGASDGASQPSEG